MMACKKKIEEYEIGKGLVADYIKSMDEKCEEMKKALVNDMDNDYLFMDNDDLFEYEETIKFLRTWKIIMNDLTPAQRNLLLTYMACDCDYTKAIEVFNGKKRNITNRTTYIQMIYLIRKRIKEIEKEKIRNKKQ